MSYHWTAAVGSDLKQRNLETRVMEVSKTPGRGQKLLGPEQMLKEVLNL